MEKRDKIMKPVTITITNYEHFEVLSGLLHGRKISRGLRIQKAIYTKIKESNKHLEVHHEFTINLPKGCQKKTHNIDIVIIDKDKLRAFDSKGKSFNATQDAQKVLEEYQLYIGILEKKYPNKKIEYGILKEGWDVPGKTKCSRYVYMSTRGIKIFDTYTFIEDNYGISKNELIDDVNNFIFEQVRGICETNN
tara:strand:- start:197 stop:775 length:579 start_codon:yes stop_codon:yes gene_type:complete